MIPEEIPEDVFSDDETFITVPTIGQHNAVNNNEQTIELADFENISKSESENTTTDQHRTDTTNNAKQHNEQDHIINKDETQDPFLNQDAHVHIQTEEDNTLPSNDRDDTSLPADTANSNACSIESTTDCIDDTHNPTIRNISISRHKTHVENTKYLEANTVNQSPNTEQDFIDLYQNIAHKSVSPARKKVNHDTQIVIRDQYFLTENAVSTQHDDDRSGQLSSSDENVIIVPPNHTETNTMPDTELVRNSPTNALCEGEYTIQALDTNVFEANGIADRDTFSIESDEGIYNEHNACSNEEVYDEISVNEEDLETISSYQNEVDSNVKIKILEPKETPGGYGSDFDNSDNNEDDDINSENETVDTSSDDNEANSYSDPDDTDSEIPNDTDSDVLDEAGDDSLDSSTESEKSSLKQDGESHKRCENDSESESCSHETGDSNKSHNSCENDSESESRSHETGDSNKSHNSCENDSESESRSHETGDSNKSHNSCENDSGSDNRSNGTGDGNKSHNSCENDSGSDNRSNGTGDGNEGNISLRASINNKSNDSNQNAEHTDYENDFDGNSVNEYSLEDHNNSTKHLKGNTMSKQLTSNTNLNSESLNSTRVYPDDFETMSFDRINQISDDQHDDISKEVGTQIECNFAEKRITEVPLNQSPQDKNPEYVRPDSITKDSTKILVITPSNILIDEDQDQKNTPETIALYSHIQPDVRTSRNSSESKRTIETNSTCEQRKNKNSSKSKHKDVSKTTVSVTSLKSEGKHSKINASMHTTSQESNRNKIDTRNIHHLGERSPTKSISSTSTISTKHRVAKSVNVTKGDNISLYSDRISLKSNRSEKLPDIKSPMRTTPYALKERAESTASKRSGCSNIINLKVNNPNVSTSPKSENDKIINLKLEDRERKISKRASDIKEYVNSRSHRLKNTHGADRQVNMSNKRDHKTRPISGESLMSRRSKLSNVSFNSSKSGVSSDSRSVVAADTSSTSSNLKLESAANAVHLTTKPTTIGVLKAEANSQSTEFNTNERNHRTEKELNKPVISISPREKGNVLETEHVQHIDKHDTVHDESYIAPANKNVAQGKIVRPIIININDLSNELATIHTKSISSTNNGTLTTTTVSQHVSTAVGECKHDGTSNKNNREDLLNCKSTNTKATVNIFNKNKPEIKTSVTDRPEIKTSATDRPELKTSVIDRPEIKTSVIDRPEIKTSVTDQSEIKTFVIERTTTGKSEDPDTQTSSKLAFDNTVKPNADNTFINNTNVDENCALHMSGQSGRTEIKTHTEITVVVSSPVSNYSVELNNGDIDITPVDNAVTSTANDHKEALHTTGSSSDIENEHNTEINNAVLSTESKEGLSNYIGSDTDHTPTSLTTVDNDTNHCDSQPVILPQHLQISHDTQILSRNEHEPIPQQNASVNIIDNYKYNTCNSETDLLDERSSTGNCDIKMSNESDFFKTMESSNKIEEEQLFSNENPHDNEKIDVFSSQSVSVMSHSRNAKPLRRDCTYENVYEKKQLHSSYIGKPYFSTQQATDQEKMSSKVSPSFNISGQLTRRSSSGLTDLARLQDIRRKLHLTQYEDADESDSGQKPQREIIKQEMLSIINDILSDVIQTVDRKCHNDTVAEATLHRCTNYDDEGNEVLCCLLQSPSNNVDPATFTCDVIDPLDVVPVTRQHELLISHIMKFTTNDNHKNGTETEIVAQIPVAHYCVESWQEIVIKLMDKHGHWPDPGEPVDIVKIEDGRKVLYGVHMVVKNLSCIAVVTRPKTTKVTLGARAMVMSSVTDVRVKMHVPECYDNIEIPKQVLIQEK